MEKVKKYYVTISQALVAFMLAFMIVINVLQMITRYFIAVQIMWVEDYSIMCLYWIFALGTPMVWLLDKHMEMDILKKIIKGKFEDILFIAMQVVGIAGGIGLICTGIRATKLNAGYVMSVAGFDELWRYIPVVVGGVFLCFACVLKFLFFIKGPKPSELHKKEEIDE